MDSSVNKHLYTFSVESVVSWTPRLTNICTLFLYSNSHYCRGHAPHVYVLILSLKMLTFPVLPNKWVTHFLTFCFVFVLCSFYFLIIHICVWLDFVDLIGGRVYT